MLTLKCICISDLQCGAPAGLLTSLPGEARDDDPAAALSKAFGAAMRGILAQFDQKLTPSLVLLGDILDLSLGTPETAATSFKRFIGDLCGTSGGTMFSGSYFLPGNHDHELWTVQRYQNFANSNLSPERRWGHITPLQPQKPALPGSAFLHSLMFRAGFSDPPSIHYPNLYLANDRGDRGVLLHHGHFTESMYTMMSGLVAAMSGKAQLGHSLEEMEKLNASWIDFFWSTIGDNGLLGSDMRLVYDYLMTGAETAEFTRRLADLLAQALADRMAYASAQTRANLQTAALAMVDYAVGGFAQAERFDYTSVLSDASRALLRSYIAGPSLAQMKKELPDKMPQRLGFAFGHTHKPFESLMALPGFAEPLRVVNTGGWILDTPVFGTCEGASVLFVDTDMNMASLRIFNIPDQDGDKPPPGFQPQKVTVSTPEGKDNDLSVALTQALAATQSAWDALSLAADAAYRDKQAWMLDNLASRDALAVKKGTLL